MFGLLVRCAGLGQFKENNSWPIAVMHRRFKCAKGEKDTDTDKILGEGGEDPSMGGCCAMQSFRMTLPMSRAGSFQTCKCCEFSKGNCISLAAFMYILACAGSSR